MDASEWTRRSWESDGGGAGREDGGRVAELCEVRDASFVSRTQNGILRDADIINSC